MGKPVDYSYRTSHEDRVRGNAEYKRFNEEYFSGQDARIYFGNTFVDEIVAFQFALQTNVAPIFGYASYTYDRMAVGSRQISGTFRINFKESYYLHFITNRLDLELGQLQKHSTSTTSKNKTAQVISPDHLVTLATTNEEKFEELAYQFEESLWGKSSNVGIQNKTNSRSNQDFFAPEDARPHIADQGFTIELFYGPYAQAYNTKDSTERVASTVHTITGVYLTGVSQVIDGSGQPIYEEYSFIGRDLDANANEFRGDPKYSFGERVTNDTPKIPTSSGGIPKNAQSR